MTSGQRKRLDRIRQRSCDAFVHPTQSMRNLVMSHAMEDIDWLISLVEELDTNGN